MLDTNCTVNSPVLQNDEVALASYTDVINITKNTVGFTLKDILNYWIMYYASDYFEVNRAVMNVNCYFIVHFSVKSFYPHF